MQVMTLVAEEAGNVDLDEDVKETFCRELLDVKTPHPPRTARAQFGEDVEETLDHEL